MQLTVWEQDLNSVLDCKSRLFPYTLLHAPFPTKPPLYAVTSGSHCSFSFMLWLSFFLKPLRFCPQFSGCPPLLNFPLPRRQFRLILSCTITSVGLTAKCASSSLDLALVSFSSCFHLEFLRTSGGSAGTLNSIFHYRLVLLC